MHGDGVTLLRNEVDIVAGREWDREEPKVRRE